MPLPIHWTPQLDSELRRLRADGATWDAIAYAFGMSRNTALQRGRRLESGRPMAYAPPACRSLKGAGSQAARLQRQCSNAWRPAPPQDDEAAERPRARLERPPLASGHAVTWGAITAGTLLDGIDYPPWSLDRAADGERSSAYAAFMAAARC